MSASSDMTLVDYYKCYTENQDEIRHLLRSVILDIASESILHDVEYQKKTMESMLQHFPFIELLYVLDHEGIQISRNIPGHAGKAVYSGGEGEDRSRRPYYINPPDEGGLTCTEPYISTASRSVCISVALRWNRSFRTKAMTGQGAILVLDCDLSILMDRLPEYRKGNSAVSSEKQGDNRITGEI